MSHKFRRDIPKLEKILEQPGPIEVIATIRVMRKNGNVFLELDSDQGISRHLLKKMLRRVSLELPRES
jgi:hypothetical protein